MRRRTFLAASAAVQAANPLLAPWIGPFGGVPPFDIAPAIEAAMVQNLAEIDAIANNSAPGKPYDRPTAKRLHEHILKMGPTVDPRVAYRQFRGHDPGVKAYLRDKGFPTA